MEKMKNAFDLKKSSFFMEFFSSYLKISGFIVFTFFACNLQQQENNRIINDIKEIIT